MTISSKKYVDDKLYLGPIDNPNIVCDNNDITVNGNIDMGQNDIEINRNSSDYTIFYHKKVDNDYQGRFKIDTGVLTSAGTNLSEIKPTSVRELQIHSDLILTPSAIVDSRIKFNTTSVIDIRTINVQYGPLFKFKVQPYWMNDETLVGTDSDDKKKIITHGELAAHTLKYYERKLFIEQIQKLEDKIDVLINKHDNCK